MCQDTLATVHIFIYIHIYIYNAIQKLICINMQTPICYAHVVLFSLLSYLSDIFFEKLSIKLGQHKLLHMPIRKI